jgi:hypothetical protein
MHHLSTISSKALRRAATKARPLLARGVHKEIKFSNEGRASILKGVDVLANAVSVTLGPKGTHTHLFLSIVSNFSPCRTECDHRTVIWWSKDHKRL